MKTEQVQVLTATVESHAQQIDSSVEHWLARDVQHLLGYTKWENFLNVVNKAKNACEGSGHDLANHSPDVKKMVDLSSGSQRDIDDIMLTRSARYRIAQIGDACLASEGQMALNKPYTLNT